MLRSGDTVSNNPSKPRVKYRMIQEEGSIFWEVITVSRCGKESSCAHVSDFDSLPRESADVTPLIFVCEVGGRAKFT